MQNLSNFPSDRLATVARYATVLLLLGLFACTHCPLPELPHQVTGLDKLAHSLIYLLLAFSVLTSWELSIGLLQPHHYFTVWLLGTLYGAFDEISQIPVGRHCDLADWLCDILGIVLGLICYRVLRPLISRVIQRNAIAN